MRHDFTIPIRRALHSYDGVDVLSRVAPGRPTLGHTASKFPGITRVAAEQGVRREHLWMVLTGKRSIAPLTPWQRIQMVNRLGEGLSERNIQIMHDALSDGHLRSCYEQAFHETPPVDLVTFSFRNQPMMKEAA